MWVEQNVLNKPCFQYFSMMIPVSNHFSSSGQKLRTSDHLSSLKMHGFMRSCSKCCLLDFDVPSDTLRKVLSWCSKCACFSFGKRLKFKVHSRYIDFGPCPFQPASFWQSTLDRIWGGADLPWGCSVRVGLPTLGNSPWFKPYGADFGFQNTGMFQGICKATGAVIDICYFKQIISYPITGFGPWSVDLAQNWQSQMSIQR